MPPAAPLRVLRTSTSRQVSGKRFASHGAPHYNEPTGYLFGEKPLPPGQKRVKEDWENVWYYGMFGGMGMAAVLLYYKPDTSIQTWALKEAKERMEARGEKVEYKPAL
ncbi:Ndufb11, NADH dehydrogenase 1 beta subcomplex subunit [Amylostereum chailletii]|nr:Ndufb11, NADH dehydrogenase 1 beta subcomplex subunit [Amylostereum chailletii]